MAVILFAEKATFPGEILKCGAKGNNAMASEFTPIKAFRVHGANHRSGNTQTSGGATTLLSSVR